MICTARPRKSHQRNELSKLPSPILYTLSTYLTSLQYQQPKYNQQYQAVFMSVHVNAYNCSLLYVLHAWLLIDKTRGHKIGSFQNEFESSLVRSESRVHVRIRMDSFENWYTIVVYWDEMKFFIYNNVFDFVFFWSFEFIECYFSLFGEKYFDLFLRELGQLDKTSSELFDSRFAGDLLMTCFLYFFEHCFPSLMNYYK